VSHKLVTPQNIKCARGQKVTFLSELLSALQEFTLNYNYIYNFSDSI